MEAIGEERTIERDRLAVLLAIPDVELTTIAPTNPPLLSLDQQEKSGSVGLRVTLQNEDERHEVARHVLATLKDDGYAFRAPSCTSPTHFSIVAKRVDDPSSGDIWVAMNPDGVSLLLSYYESGAWSTGGYGTYDYGCVEDIIFP